MDVTGVWAWMLLDTDALGDVVGTGLLGEMDARGAPHRSGLSWHALEIAVHEDGRIRVWACVLLTSKSGDRPCDRSSYMASLPGSTKKI